MSDTEVLPGVTESAGAPPPASPSPESAGEGGSQATPRSVRDELNAAWDADAAKQAEPEGAAAPTGDKPRNELGQFVKQADKPAEPQTQSASGEPRASAPKVLQAVLRPGTEAQGPEAITPPASWSPAAKAAFAALPEVVRSEIAKREGDWNQGQAQRTQDAERLNRLHSVLTPYHERFRLSGIEEAQAVQQLLSASDFLERDPVNALLYLARAKGVDPRYLAQVYVGGGADQGQQQQPNELQQVYAEVQALKQGLAQEQTAQRNAQYQQMLSEVDTFAKDPAHVYFENVRHPMATLVEAGQARDLEDAYQQATWAHPEIRPLLIQQQVETQQKAAAEAARARAVQARHASGSITGSPTPGVAPGANGSKLSLREELQHNWNEFSG